MTHNVNVNGISGGASVHNSSSEGMIRHASSELMEGSSNCKALKKGPWTAAEDQTLMEYVRTHGEGNWNSVQRNSGLNRCGKSCRLRWANHLRPNLKKGAFTPEEERLILELHAKYGNKWARMASQLPGRTDNEIKNYWNTRVKRRQRQGLPLYPHDIKQSQHQQSHSHSHSHPTALTIPTGLTQQASATGACGGLPPAGQTFCFQFQTSSSSSSSSQQQQQQQHLPPMAPTATHHSPLSSPGKSHQSLHFFDPSSFANSSAFAFHRPAPILGGAPLRYKRYREGASVAYSPPISPSQRSASILRASSMPDICSNQPFSAGTASIPDMASFQYQQPRTFHGSLPPLPRSGSSPFDFGNILLSSPTRPVYSVKSEQVLSQAHSQSELSTDSKANAAGAGEPHYSSSNGLLDDLLQEAEAMVACGASNPRKAGGSNNINLFEDHQKHVMDGYGRWLATNSVDSSFLEGKPIVEVDHNNSMPDDLSKLLSFMPSTETISDWYTRTDSGELSNGGQSSGVTEASLEFDVMQQHMASLFPVNVGSTDHDRVNSNTWDNLSGIC